MTTKQTPAPKADAKLTIQQAAQKYNVSAVYIRRSILNGKLTAAKELIPDTKIERHMILEADFLAWRESSKGRSKRTDGRNRLVLYATKEEVAEIKKAAANVEIAKPKSYKKKASKA